MNTKFRDFIACTYQTVSFIIFSLPRHKIFNVFKRNYIRLFGGVVGNSVTFYPGIRIHPLKNIIIGDKVDLAWGVIITTGGNVKIGARTLVGYRTIIASQNHIIPSKKGQIFGSGHIYQDVNIESDVWIGANCVILPGIKIGKGSIIGAGSVVTKNVPAYTIVAGNPARILKFRD